MLKRKHDSDFRVQARQSKSFGWAVPKEYDRVYHRQLAEM